jgi:hypothetical protein
VELELLKTKTRLIDEKFASVRCERETLFLRLRAIAGDEFFYFSTKKRTKKGRRVDFLKLVIEECR